MQKLTLEILERWLWDSANAYEYLIREFVGDAGKAGGEFSMLMT